MLSKSVGVQLLEVDRKRSIAQASPSRRYGKIVNCITADARGTTVSVIRPSLRPEGLQIIRYRCVDSSY